MSSISYAITACNEHVELERLLEMLENNIRPEDEVIIQIDSTATSEVKALCIDYIRNNWYAIEFPLDKDFASFKNNLSKYCTKDYIFQIDADEYPHLFLIQSLPQV